MNKKTIFSPKTLSLMPTWQCTAACTDCGTFSHPKNKIRLLLNDILVAIKRASEAHFQVVVFTGGEATLRWDDLLISIEHARTLGLSTRLVTNAWWARTPSDANLKLSQLKGAGLKEINFSTGDEHARFIPLDHVVNAIIASVEMGFEPQIMVEVKFGAKITKSMILNDEKLKKNLDTRLSSVNVSESPWMPMDSKVLTIYPASHYITAKNLGLRGGCDSLFSTHTLQADGTIAACCGLGIRKITELQMGRFDQDNTSFEAIEAKAESNLLLLLIKRFGPERLLAKVAKLNPAVQWEGLYAHQCHACSRVFNDPQVLETISLYETQFTTELAAALATDRLLEIELLEAKD